MPSHTLHLHIRQAVKADKPERNYITLEQFLAWYLGNPRVIGSFSAKVTGAIGVVDDVNFKLSSVRLTVLRVWRLCMQARKWRSVRSGDYDISMARLSIIRVRDLPPS